MAIRKTSTSNILNTVHRDASAGSTKIADIPDTPTIGTATAGAESATITYTVANTGGIGTTFTALSNPGSITGTGSSPITVSGLTAATAYTFTVKSGNTTGDSPYSSASNSITALAGGAFESIATVTVGSGGTSTITFSSIPATYKHLQIRALARTDRAGNYSSNMNLQFNTDTANNYADHDINGNGSTAQAESGTTKNNIAMNRITGASSGSDIFGVVVADILDYTNTNKYKTVRWFGGFDNNSTQGEIYFGSGLWQSTSAVSTITLQSVSGAVNFTQYSSFALYGIKGA